MGFKLVYASRVLNSKYPMTYTYYPVLGEKAHFEDETAADEWADSQCDTNWDCDYVVLFESGKIFLSHEEFYPEAQRAWEWEHEFEPGYSMFGSDFDLHGDPIYGLSINSLCWRQVYENLDTFLADTWEWACKVPNPKHYAIIANNAAARKFAPRRLVTCHLASEIGNYNIEIMEPRNNYMPWFNLVYGTVPDGWYATSKCARVDRLLSVYYPAPERQQGLIDVLVVDAKNRDIFVTWEHKKPGLTLEILKRFDIKVVH